ncbi:MAG: hypothetical protein QW074_05015, partial [Candidatus Caldarchaeum sp.]
GKFRAQLVKATRMNMASDINRNPRARSVREREPVLRAAANATANIARLMKKLIASKIMSSLTIIDNMGKNREC